MARAPASVTTGLASLPVLPCLYIISELLVRPAGISKVHDLAGGSIQALHIMTEADPLSRGLCTASVATNTFQAVHKEKQLFTDNMKLTSPYLPSLGELPGKA